MHRPAPRFPGAEEQEVLVGAAQTGSSLAAPARCSERYLYRADTRTARRISLSHERFGGAVDAPAEGVQLNKPGGIVERSKLAVGDETVELEVDGRMVLIVTRPADGDALAALVAKGALNGVHFHTDDLDATFEKVRASGAEIVQEPTEQPWGTRDCAVRDPSGNLVRIDQPPAASS